MLIKMDHFSNLLGVNLDLGKCNAVAVKHKSLLELICVNAFCKLHTAESFVGFSFQCSWCTFFFPSLLRLGKRPGLLGLSNVFFFLFCFFFVT
jgi:hypothetical protein